MSSRDNYNDNNSYNENSSYNRRDEGRNESYGRDERRNDSYGNNERRNDSYGNEERRNDSYGNNERRNDSYGNDERRNDSYGRDERQNDSYGRDERQNDSYGRDERRNDSYGRDERRNDSYGNEGRNEGRHGDYNDTRYEGSHQYSGGDDFSSAAQHAQSHNTSSDSSLFNSALSFLNERKGQFQDPSRIEVDEQHAVQAHNAMYNSGGNEEGRSHDSSTVGAGAAMQALKMFTSGGSSDGGMDKNKLIGLAMAQAGSLWDQKEGAGASMSGDKQSAVNSAAEMALKMYMKSQGGGIGGTGGASGLMSLASKFL